MNAFQKTLKSLADAFVTKFDQAGNKLVYSTYLGGSGEAAALGVTVDAHGSAYVTGAAGLDFPTKNAFQKELKGPENAFVTKFDPAGNALVYSTYLDGNDFAWAYSKDHFAGLPTVVFDPCVVNLFR
jgi:hypothetical protein